MSVNAGSCDSRKNSNSNPDTSYTGRSYWSVTCIWIWRVINGVSDQYESGETLKYQHKQGYIQNKMSINFGVWFYNPLASGYLNIWIKK